MGASHGWRGVTVGAAVSYGHTDLHLQGLSQQGYFDTGALALYGERRMGAFFFDAAGSIAYDHGDTTRNILFPGVARRTTGSFDGYTGAVLLSAGARADARDGLLFEPSLNLAYSHVSQNGFGEKGGGGADLLIGDRDQDALQGTLQAKVSKPITLANGNLLLTDVKVAWAHEFSPTGTSITEAFAAPGGDAFVVQGATPDANYGILGAGLAYSASKQLTYFGRYEATLGQHQRDSAFTAGFKFVW
jgi:outer membrane autotransporter protein